MKGATIVVKSLEDLGVKHVFGYTGAAILPIIDELAQSSIEIVEWIAHAAALKRSWPLDYRRDTECIQQAEVLDLLNRHIGHDTIITTGVGNHQLLAAQYLRMDTPKSFLTSGSFGTMGFGMPTAIGAHYANPHAQIVVVDGDGSFRMNMGELYTIGTRNSPIKILLLNNLSDGMVKNLEDVAYGGRHSATVRTCDVNFAEMAKHCHFQFAERTTCRSELSAALRAFMQTGGPCLLEVMTDTEEVLYPVVRPGTSYSEMVLGPYIREVPAGDEGGRATHAPHRSRAGIGK